MKTLALVNARQYCIPGRSDELHQHYYGIEYHQLF